MLYHTTHGLCSLPGQPAYLYPTKIPPQDRHSLCSVLIPTFSPFWMHLVDSEFYPDSNAFSILELQLSCTVTRLKPTAQETQTETTGSNLQLKKPKQKRQGDTAHHLNWCGRHYL
eukprot:1143257-Pelagomonas_calceolata.AAC.6